MSKPIRFVIAACIVMWILCSVATAQTLTESWDRLDDVLNDARSTDARKVEALRAAMKQIRADPADPEAGGLFRHAADQLRILGQEREADEEATWASGTEALPLAFEACKFLGMRTDPEVSSRAYERMNDIADRARRLPGGDLARELLREALDPAEEATRWFTLATIYRTMGRPDRAAPWLERVAKWAEGAGDPLREEALTGLADCQTALGDKEAARKTIERLHSAASKAQGDDLAYQEALLQHDVADPTSLEFARRLEELFLAAQAKGTLDEVSVREHRAWLGNLYMGNGDYRRAAEEFDAWLPLVRLDRVTSVFDVLPNLEFAAEAHARLGQPERAMAVLAVLFRAVAGLGEKEWKRDPTQYENLQKAVALAKELQAAKAEHREPDLLRVLAEGGRTDASGVHTALPALYHEVTDEGIRAAAKPGVEKGAPRKDDPPAPPVQPRAPNPKTASEEPRPRAIPNAECAWMNSPWVPGGSSG